MRLFVGNLNWQCTDTDLWEHFAQYGEVTAASVILDREMGRSKGFGFVTMASDKDGESAIRELNGTMFMSRALKIDEAKEKPQRVYSNRDRRD